MSDSPRDLPPPLSPAEASTEPSASLPVLTARDLFRGQREILIEHDGVVYRLRLTRRNKLILQK
ncbi:MAG: hemin uptake protein HemP [Gemmataceae bacterium]